MGISNLNNQHLTKEQKNAVLKTLAELEKQLAILNINLTADDRNKYGRVNEQNKLFINKVQDYAQNQPQLRSFDVDWEEFERDFESREFLEKIITRLNSLATRANNSKVLHDYDNYQDALNDYAYTNFRAGSNSAGYENKQADLKQFFLKKRKKTAENNTEQPQEETNND